MTLPTGAAGAALTGAYEDRRAWAGGQPLAGPRPPGLALLLRGGVPAWLVAVTTRLPPAAARAAAPGAGHATGPPAAVADLTLVLATMVAACQQEELS